MVKLARPFDTWDVLKVAALLLMFVDHAGIFLINDDKAAYYIRAVGRGAAVIFMFLAGYAKSYKFSWELFGLAVGLTAFDWVFFWHVDTLNILFTILISRAFFNWFEKRGRVIKRPVEWYVGAVALFILMAITEYGTMGFIMALAGYMRRYRAEYSDRLRYGLSAVIFVTYAFFQVAFFKPDISPVVATVVIGVAMLWCMRFEMREVTTAHLSRGGKRVLKYTSRYSGYIYVAHLVALKLFTGIEA